MTNLDYALYERCYISANLLIQNGYVQGGLDLEKVADTLYKLELEKIEKNKISDSLLDYNDEVVSIEDAGQKETIDISVSGDNLFFCNDILTKNSFGLPATADLMFALINTEELEKLGQLMVKQLKNRYNDPSTNKRFVVGIDRSKMKLFDVEGSAQIDIVDSGQSGQYTNNSSFSQGRNERSDKFKKLRTV